MKIKAGNPKPPTLAKTGANADDYNEGLVRRKGN